MIIPKKLAPGSIWHREKKKKRKAFPESPNPNFNLRLILRLKPAFRLEEWTALAGDARKRGSGLLCAKSLHRAGKYNVWYLTTKNIK